MQVNRVKLSLCLLLTLAASSAVAEDAGEQTAFPSYANAYFQVQGLALQRAGLDKDGLVDNDNTANPMDHDAGDIDIDPGFGALARVGVAVESSHVDYVELEALGFGFSGFFSVIDTGDTLDLAYSSDVNSTPSVSSWSNSEEAVRADFDYDSLFLAAGLAGKHIVNNNTTVFAGPRYVFYRSTLDVLVDDDATTLASPNIDRVDVDVDNHLLGLQGGVEYSRPVTERINLGFRGSVGVFYNHAKIDSHARAISGAGDNVEKSFSQNEIATILEAQSEFKFKLTDTVHFVSGGFIQWTNGIVESTNEFGQVSVVGDENIGTQDLFVYGGRVGFKAIF